MIMMCVLYSMIFVFFLPNVAFCILYIVFVCGMS